MRELRGRPDLCAINTATLGFQASIADVIDAVARHGFGGIAPWRREVEGGDVKAIARRIRDAKLAVTGYCRSSFIPAPAREAFDANIEANRRAIDDAALLGAQSFVMVVGSLPQGSKDIAAARAQVEEGTALLADYAAYRNVKIALEPLHPVYAADRSCLTTIDEALGICDRIGSANIGLCLDVYHIWWDPELAAAIARARCRILGFHVCDWLANTADVLNDRGMMGDGVVDIPHIRELVETAGYRGFIEVEIFSAANWWKRPMDETLAMCKQRFATCC